MTISPVAAIEAAMKATLTMSTRLHVDDLRRRVNDLFDDDGLDHLLDDDDLLHAITPAAIAAAATTATPEGNSLRLCRPERRSFPTRIVPRKDYHRFLWT